MTMLEAVGIARRVLAEHYDLYLIDRKMYGRNHEGDKAADAYNRLAEFDLVMKGVYYEHY